MWSGRGQGDRRGVFASIYREQPAPLFDLLPISNQVIDEGQLLTVTPSLLAGSSTANTFTVVGSLPNGATLNASTGRIEWTPGEVQGPGNYAVTVTAHGSNGLSDSETFTITVNEVNLPPVLGAITDRTATEGTAITFTASASDPDTPSNTLIFSLVGTVPAGATINPTSGQFNWTPNGTQGTTTFPITVQVSDGVGGADQKTFTVTVTEDSLAPSLSPIGNRVMDEQTMLTFTATATDANQSADTLTFTLENAPSAASIDPATGVFTWTPTEADGPGSVTATVVVTNNTDQIDSETITITVNEVNLPPVLVPIGNQSVVAGESLTFTAIATDVDLPENTLIYAISGDVPAAATLDASTGVFTWNSLATDTPGELIVTVSVNDQNGGIDSETFTITVQSPSNPSITLTEDDRFASTASQAIIVPAAASYFEFEIRSLSFDTDATGQIKDAFEVALLDADGNSLVHTIAAERDAFFNVSEPGTQAAATNTAVNGTIVRVDLSQIPAGTQATVVYRLINNDNADGNDTATTVTVSKGSIIAGDLNTPGGAPVAPSFSEATGTVDLTTLIDVTSSLSFEYAQTSFNDDTDTLFVDVWVTNNSSQPIDGPFVLVVQNLTDPRVVVSKFDGTSYTGDRYYLLEDLSITGTILPGDSTLVRTLSFINPNKTPFDYRLTVLAAPNEAPAFTSAPITLVEANRSYSYDSNAEDPDGDTLTYELLAGPNGMTIDASTGKINWAPQSSDLGNNSVVIKASDGRGAFDEQQFAIEVRDLVSNRPPVIISSPVTQVVLPSVRPKVIGVWNQFRSSEWNLVDGEFTDTYRADLAATFGSAVVTGTAALSADFLSGIDILVIGSTGSGVNVPIKPLTAIEQSALYDFVARGGSALLMTENNFQYEAASNSLVAPFGLTSGGFNQNEFRVTVTDPDHPVFNGPNGAVNGYDLLFPGEFVDLGPNAVSIAEIAPGRSVAAFIEPGKLNPGSGAVVALVGQVTMADDDLVGLPPTYSLDSEERIIHKNIISFLGGADIASTPTSVYEYDVNAIDADIDPLTYSLQQGPAGMQINPTTGEITWLPKLGQSEGRAGDATVANYTQVDFSEFTNMRIQDNGNWVTQSYQGGPINVDGVPFNLPLEGNSSWLSHYDSAGNYNSGQSVLELNVDIFGATEVHSLINSYWGENDPGVRAHVEFFGSEGAFYRFDLDGNDDIRDFNQNQYTNEINGDTTVNAVSFSGNSDRLDKVKMTLPDEFATQTLQRIRFVDDGSYGYQLMFVSGVTVATETPVGDSNHVTILVEDGRGGSAVQEYDLAVLADPTNTAPVIISDPVDHFFIPGFSNPASGNVAPQRISLDPGNGETFDGTVSITLPDNAARFADIVISVDESSSMGGDQDWIPDMIPLLDQALKDAGIGATAENPNRFAIVGGGRQNLVSYFFSQQPNTRYTLYGPDNSVVATGVIDEILPDELLNLQFQDDGRYVLVVESQNPSDLVSGIDIGIKGEVGDGVRVEQLQLNTLVSDDFLLPGQPVEYRFSLSADTLLYFDSQTKDDYSSITWSLDGPTGRLANNIRFNSSDTSDTTPIYNAVPGDYQLTIDATYDTASDFKFQLINLAAVTQISSGETVSDEFETKVGTKAYRFTAEKGQLFGFDNSTTGVHSGSIWRLIDQSGNVLISRNIGTNQSPFELPYSGQYFLLMEAALSPLEGSQQLRQPSTFEFTAEFVDPAPPTPITLGNTVNGTIDFVGDFVEYSFTLTDRSNLYLDSLTNNSMTWLLTGPAGTRAAVRFDDSDSFDNVNPVMNLVAGDYTIRVNSGGLEGAFAFRLFDLADATPITPGTVFSGELTIPNETDLYKFNASAGDEFLVDVVTASDTGNTLYRIYDQYGRKIEETRSLTDQPDLVIPVDGEYTLLVEGRRTNTGQDTYSINLELIGSTTPTPPPFDETLTLDALNNGSVSLPGDTTTYGFSLSEFTLVHFDSLTNSSSFRWKLTDSVGTVVSSRAFSGSDSYALNNPILDLPPDDYRLTVNANSGVTGDFAFRLLDLSSALLIGYDAIVTDGLDHLGGGDAVWTTGVPLTGSATNGAIDFSRPTDSLNLPAATLDGVSDFTIEFWYKTTKTGLQGLVSAANSTDANELLIELISDTEFAVAGIPSWDIASIADGQWHHYAVTQEIGTGTTFYLDGVNLGIRSATRGTLSIDEGGLFVGQEQDAVGFNLDLTQTADGQLDELRIWETVRSETQINNNKDSVVAANATGIRAYYRFDETSGDVAADQTVNSFDAQYTRLTQSNSTKAYQFSAQPGDIVLFESFGSDVKFSLNPYWRLVDQYGNQIFSSNFSSATTPRTLDGGIYTLLIEGDPRDVEFNGGYSFQITSLGNAVNPVTPAALTPGEVVNGNIEKRYETDLYAFSLSEDTLGVFDSLTNDSSLNWTLRNQLGTVVSSRAFNSSLSSLLRLPAGDYELSISSNTIEPYSFSFFDLKTSPVIVPGTSETGELTIANEADIYQFSGLAGDQVYLDVISVSSAGRADFSVVNELGVVLTSSTSLIDQDTFTLPDDGQYFIIVAGKINQTMATAYEINVVPTSTASASLTLGATQPASIDTIGQSIEYSFNLPVEASLYFDSLTDSGSIRWSLQGAAGNVVSNRLFNDSDSFDFEDPLLDSLAAGNYTLTVTAVGDAVGNFSFRLVDVASAMLVTPGTPVSGELTIANETDIYRFDAAFGDQIFIDWISADDTNNSLYRVFDPFGKEIFELRDLLDAELPPLPFTGTYTLLVEGDISNAGLDTYEFNLINAVTRTVAINVGDVINETLAVGDKVAFTFNVATDAFLYFDSLTADNSGVNWSLIGPTGVVVSSRRIDRSDSLDFDSVFEARAGNYRLTVDGLLDTIGDFGFRLRDLSTGMDFTLPTTVGQAVSVSGTLTPGISSDIHRFQANAGDDLSFVYVPPSDNAASYRLVDPFGRTVYSRSLTGNQSNVELIASGTYTLLVEGRFSATVDNGYQLDVFFNGNTPPTGLIGDALTLGATQNGNLTAGGQVDSYQFALTQRSLLHMDVLTNSSTFRWTLRGPRGIEVSNRTFTSTDSFDSNTSNMDLVAGGYQLDIFASSGIPGAYGFTLHDFSDAIAITPGTAFPLAPNNTLGAETDLYKFSASAGDRFLIDVVSASQTNNAEMKVIDEYGIVIALQSSLTDRDQIVIPHDGTYTLLVEGDQDNQAADTYSINIVPIVTATFALTSGTTNNGNLQPGQEHKYIFSVTDPSLLLFAPKTSSNQVLWTLSSDDGTFVDSREFDDGILPIKVLAGDYTLTVDGVNGYAGAAEFTVVVADPSSQLAFGDIANTQLTQSNSVAVYQFNGVAGQHFALRPDFNLVFDDSATSALTADDLRTSYYNEDQHAGIDVALRNDVFRDGAAINFIIVSDEDRDVSDDNVNFATIFADLSARDALLNSIVASGFRDENNAIAIGVDSDGNAYVADGLGGFTVSQGGRATTSNISIKQDYIDLAWALDGAAWDLGRLRAGGVTAESFTNAFVDVKVAEILEQTALRLISSNATADFEVITPTSGQYTSITGGQTYDFDVHIGNNGRPMSYDLLFKQGQTIGSIPVYIISPYEYGALAIDSDGDTLTWSLVTGPAGLAIDVATGVLAWTDDDVMYGEHDVTIRVEDGRGGFDEQTFVLDVNGGEGASISGTVYAFDATTPINVELLNGSFEIPNVPIGGFTNFTGSELPGWTVETSGPHVSIVEKSYAEAGITFQSKDGNQWIDLEGLATQAPNGISQVVTTVPGQTYTLGFYVGSTFLASSYDASTVDLSINDGASISFTNLTTPTDRLDWQRFEHEFVATGTETKIAFFNGSSVGNYVSALDNVSLTSFLGIPSSPSTVFIDRNRNEILDESEISTVTDPSGNYVFAELPSGSYSVRLLPQSGQRLRFPSSRSVALSLDPGENASNVQFVIESVPLVNTDPKMTSDPIITIVAGEHYSYTPTTEELDGDTLTFDLPLAPAGMVLNSSNGTIRWTPRLDQIGSQNVLLRVRDGRGGFDLQYFTVQVTEPNIAPTIISTPPGGPAGVGLPFSYDVNAVDTGTDTLTFSLTDAPTGATINSATGVINWIPTSGQAGSQDFVVTVDDGRGLNDEQTFSINVEVNPVNADPQIQSTSPLEAYLGSNYLYRVRATDSNGDPLTFALDESPNGMTIDADGLVLWTPTPAQVGINLVRILVNDGRGGVATQEYSVDVDTQPVNQAPRITSPPQTSAVAGQAYNFQPTAVDPNNDTLVWELVSGPLGMSLNPDVGTIHWNPTINDLGSAQVVIRVFDTSAAYSELGYTLNVRAVNSPPVIRSTPLTSAAVGATFLYQVQATDADGDLLSYALMAVPAGMVVDPATGLIQWTPTSGQQASNTVQVQVSDGNGGFVTQSFTVETAAGVNNIPPTITSTPGFFAGVGDLYGYDVDANDPENGTLNYELLQSPASMTIDASSGLIEWTPTAGNLGTTIVRLIARDPDGAGSIQEYSLTVLAANVAPGIHSTPPATVSVGVTYRYDVLANDTDSEFLTYELVNSPSGMLIDGVGRIFWLPTAAQAGSHGVEVKVTDPRGGTVTQSFDITVETDTADPKVAIQLSRNPVNVGSLVDIRVSAIDNVGVEALSLMLDGVPVALDTNGMARVPMNAVGSFTALATATDSAGNSATNSIQIFVADPNDVQGPTLSITSPGDGGTVTSLTGIFGSVNDDTLVEYRLYVAPFGSFNFQQIGSGNTNVTNGILGQFDPTLLANGSYVLRLEAEDAGGRSNVIQQLVEITSENKLGNFRVGFTDLVVPVSGIDVVLSRTYDSLNSSEDSDFGFGWRMDFRDVQLQVSVVDASDFDKAYGFYTPYRDRTRVYITLPGGKREAFTFTPVQKGLPGLTYYNPRFTADAGVTSTLTVANASLSYDFGEYSGFASAQPYNPAAFEFGGRFTLTTKDGLVYTIDAGTGKVTRITDPNGNRLDFSDSGVTSNSGVSITFERDTRGRVVAAIDPDGDRLEYAYSVTGDLASLKDRSGNVTTYKYEASRQHFLTEILDPLGNTGIRGEYDGDGRLISLSNGGEAQIQISTNVGANIQVYTDELGNQTFVRFDDRGNTVFERDANGNETTRLYDLQNNLLMTTNALGETKSFTYDSFGNRLTATNADGSVTALTYANAGRGLIGTAVAPGGRSGVSSYDRSGNLVSTLVNGGNLRTYSYDSRGNLVSASENGKQQSLSTYGVRENLTSERDAEGNLRQYTYDENGNMLTSSYELQTPSGSQVFTTTYRYDASDRLKEVVDTLGGVSKFEYDAAGQRVAAIDALNRRTEYVYNAMGLLTSTVYPDDTTNAVDNPREFIEYDAKQQITALIDRNGNRTEFDYDAVGNLVETIYPDSTPEDFSDNPRTIREYDALNRLVATTDENGNKTSLRYDNVGRLIQSTDANGISVLQRYNINGLMSESVNELGNVTLYLYDEFDRLSETVFADGNSILSEYETGGLRSAAIDQLGNRTEYDHDSSGRLTALVDAAGGKTGYAYDMFDNLILQVDAAGNATQYEYDPLQRRIRTIRPTGEVATTSYDAVGNIVSQTDFNGQTINFIYDASDRPILKELPDGQTVAYQYDFVGNVTQIEDYRGITTFRYDERDRLTSQVNTDGTFLTYEYDLTGNRTLLETPSGTTRYEFDAMNRLTLVIDQAGDETSYSYDAIGQLLLTEYANGTKEFRHYDVVGNIVGMENRNSTTSFIDIDYTYNAKRFLTSAIDATGRKVDYVYDSLDRLISETIVDPLNGNREITYVYDSVGNRLERSDSAEGVTTYTYDNNDRMIAETTNGVVTSYKYDANGNTLTRSVDGTLAAVYMWDSEGRLVAVDADGDGSVDVVYEYDDFGNQLERTAGGSTTKLLTDRNLPYAQVVEEYTDGGIIQASYVFGTQRISQVRGGSKSYYHFDRLGSTVALSNAAGGITVTYTYDAFGREISMTGATLNAFQFAGEFRDTITGLDYLRARHLDTASGRFLSTDSYLGEAYSPQTLHRYLYVYNNPTNYVDPSGEIGTLAGRIAVLGIIGTTLAVASIGYSAKQGALNDQDKIAEPWTQLEYKYLDVMFEFIEDVDYHQFAGFILRHLTAGGIVKKSANLNNGGLTEDGSIYIAKTHLGFTSFPLKAFRERPGNAVVAASILVHELAHFMGAGADDFLGWVYDATAYNSEKNFLNSILSQDWPKDERGIKQSAELRLGDVNQILS